MTSCPKCELLDVDEASAKIKKNKKKQKEDKAKSRRKILWRIVFLFSLVGFTYQSYQFLKEYLSNPVVITGYVQTGVPQNFPSITVCSYSKKLNEILPDTKPVRLADDGLNNMSCDWVISIFFKIKINFFKMPKNKYKRKSLNDLKITCLLVVKNVLTSHVEADQIHSSQRAQFLLLIKTLVLLLSEELFLTLPIELLNERKMNIYFQVSQKFDKQCSVISVTYSFLKARYMPDRIKRSIEWPRQPLKDKPNKDDSKALIDHKNMKSLRKIESATTIDERIELGQSAESVIYSCHFMGRVCDYKNFTHSYTYKYGNCWNFDPENEDGEPSKALEAGPMFGKLRC
ncbi:Amiloride-sensitive sodium channel subunit beta-2 [Nymphon striatum]|nr:Amiloride-sensitive sodium channel subunit beta-2 [Nymphon striatum]